MKKKFTKQLLNEHGEASYISTVVYILIVAMMLAFIMNVFHVITVKQKMDHMADQMVKQIQLGGSSNSDTANLFRYLASELSEVEGLSYQVTSSGSTSRIQLGTPFYVTITGRYYLGGFANLNLVPITIQAKGAGVSEHYWK